MQDFAAVRKCGCGHENGDLFTRQLQQVVLSRLVNCVTVSEVNTQLKPDMALAHAWNLTHWADQSTLMRTLDTLTQLNIGQVRTAATTIWRAQS
jgi:hypothetical protein